MQTRKLSSRLAQVTGTCEGAFPPSHSFDLGLELRCVCCEKTQADTWARDFLSLVTFCVGVSGRGWCGWAEPASPLSTCWSCFWLWLTALLG